MPQADVITNGSIIITSFPLFILIHFVLNDSYDDSAIEDRLYDFMETTTDTERSINFHESLLQELIATIPVYINELFLTNFLTLKNWINSYCYIFNQFESLTQIDMRILMNTHLFDIYALNNILFEAEDTICLFSFQSLFNASQNTAFSNQNFLMANTENPARLSTSFSLESEVISNFTPLNESNSFVFTQAIDVKSFVDNKIREKHSNLSIFDFNTEVSSVGFCATNDGNALTSADYTLCDFTSGLSDSIILAWKPSTDSALAITENCLPNFEGNSLIFDYLKILDNEIDEASTINDNYLLCLTYYNNLPARFLRKTPQMYID